MHYTQRTQNTEFIEIYCKVLHICQQNIPFSCSWGAVNNLRDRSRAMGHLPALCLHWSNLRGWDLPLWHCYGGQPAGQLPQAGPVYLQAPDPFQGDAGGSVPAAALLPGPCIESCSSCGGAAVWGGESDPTAGAGAPERRRVPADLQWTRCSRVPVHCDWYCEKRYSIGSLRFFILTFFFCGPLNIPDHLLLTFCLETQ